MTPTTSLPRRAFIELIPAGESTYVRALIEEFGMTVMMIEHDMGVVMDISHRVMVLDFGRKIAEGNPAAVLADPHVRRAYLGEEDEVLVDPDDTPSPAETAA